VTRVARASNLSSVMTITAALRDADTRRSAGVVR
jgi:hypothetical protein